MNTLYIFLDESGNLDFSPGGTKHYVLAAVTTVNPLVSSQDLQQLKYTQLENGVDTEYFHASEDRQATRNEVIKCLQTMSNTIKVHYIYANKPKTNPSLQTSAKFYSKLGTTLCKFIVGYKTNGYSKIVIVFDKALTKKDQRAFLGEIKPELKRLGKPYEIYFHRTLSDFNGQIADYFAWAKYVSLERSEMRPLESLSNIKMTEFDIFSRGTRLWY
ncbi:MAG: DUF3800 domain-containing protein [Candidatus Saccharimonadales bacterium]